MLKSLIFNTFERGDTIPARPDTLWLLKEGVVKVITLDEKGSTITLGYWGKDDVVGQPLSQVKPYQIRCLTAVEAARIPINRFDWLSQPIQRHLHQTEKLLYLIRCDCVSVRLLNILIWLSERFGHSVQLGRYINLRLTHQEIAEIAGSTRVTITRLLNKWERQGIISRMDGHIVILSPALARVRVLETTAHR